MIQERFVKLYGLLWLLVASLAHVQAQPATDAAGGWYVGAQGGVPFGMSGFSSFGADKVRAGWNGGLYGGYHFNPILSLEAQAAFGQIHTGAQACCIDHDYWLGADGVRYLSPVAGIDGWSYAGLKSRTAFQRYGLQLNLNLLGFLERTRQSRWAVELSPLVAAVRTKATVGTIAGGTEVRKGPATWHLGAGGNLQADYRLTEQLHIGIYSGITCLTGDRMDGMPEDGHRNNLVWESGIKLGWSFGKREKRRRSVGEVTGTAVPLREATESAASQDTVRPPEAEVAPKEEKKEADKATTAVSAVETPQEAALTFSTVYFAFNSIGLSDSELPKLQRILETLRQYPDVHICITGWCDSRGSVAVNDRISRQRAEAVSRWLVKNGIAAGRITVQGKGIDQEEGETAKARRVEVRENK